jgi:glycosyltransferase involved in cell wall biosynthesis
MKSNNKIKVVWFLTPFYPRYGVANIVHGWAENIDYNKYDITLACHCIAEKKELLNNFEKFPIKIVFFPNLASFKSLYIPQLKSLDSFFKNNSFDIIHSIFIQADIIAAYVKNKYKIPVHTSSIMGQLISKSSGSKLVSFLKKISYKFLYNSFCSNIDSYFPITNTSMNQLNNELNVNYNRFVTIYSGVPTDLVKSTRNKEEFLIGAASQLIFEKGLDILIKSFELVKKEIPNAKLAIAGHGDYEKELLQLSDELNLTNHIKFLGFERNMPEFMSSINLFVFPARPSYDGLPRVILEAMVQKTAVIASDTEEISEIMNFKGINGTLFKVEDHIDLSRKIIKNYQNQIQISQLTENAYRMANSISVKNNIKKIQEEYQLLLNK